jgi:hypothetical protein
MMDFDIEWSDPPSAEAVWFGKQGKKTKTKTYCPSM